MPTTSFSQLSLQDITKRLAYLNDRIDTLLFLFRSNFRSSQLDYHYPEACGKGSLLGRVYFDDPLELESLRSWIEGLTNNLLAERLLLQAELTDRAKAHDIITGAV